MAMKKVLLIIFSLTCLYINTNAQNWVGRGYDNNTYCCDGNITLTAYDIFVSSYKWFNDKGELLHEGKTLAINNITSTKTYIMRSKRWFSSTDYYVTIKVTPKLVGNREVYINICEQEKTVLNMTTTGSVDSYEWFQYINTRWERINNNTATYTTGQSGVYGCSANCTCGSIEKKFNLLTHTLIHTGTIESSKYR